MAEWLHFDKLIFPTDSNYKLANTENNNMKELDSDKKQTQTRRESTHGRRKYQ